MFKILSVISGPINLETEESLRRHRNLTEKNPSFTPPEKSSVLSLLKTLKNRLRPHETKSTQEFNDGTSDFWGQENLYASFKELTTDPNSKKPRGIRTANDCQYLLPGAYLSGDDFWG